MSEEQKNINSKEYTLVDKIIRFCLENKFIVILLALGIILWGLIVAPFDWDFKFIPRNPVHVDAIPDIGENQQIVFTDWMGRSPQDVENQITYPLTSALLGVPGIKTIRSYSMFGFSSIYVIFKDDVDFYWSRSRILEKLNSLPEKTLPEGVKPALGPDATGLGQVFWYTLEGQDKNGNPTGGWGLDELRSVQDWYVRYALLSADGVSEVASIGGFVKEYQIDVNPSALISNNIMLDELLNTVKSSNIDVGARTIDINNVEYLVRGLGFIKTPADIENSVIKSENNVPLLVKNVANVSLGPALRQGILDKEGTEAVGGVVVVRYGANPMSSIKSVKEKINEISAGLPKKTLADGTISQVKVVPFYDRTQLIQETLGTLNTALYEEILVTIIVILMMVMHLRSSILISGLLPLTVLMCFIAMKIFKVDANIVALSGIAIAIGTIVDMGIIICENILRHLGEAPPDKSKLEVIFEASSEVGGAVLTAVSTTVVGFLPVFTMTAQEGKLFKPLAFTKTFCLISSLIVALTIIPPLAHLMFTTKIKKTTFQRILYISLLILGVFTTFFVKWQIGLIIILMSIFALFEHLIPAEMKKIINYLTTILVSLFVIIILSKHWMPLGPEKGLFVNTLFAGGIIGGLLAFALLFQFFYEYILRFCLRFKFLFLSIPLFFVIMGAVIWLGFDYKYTFGWLPKSIRHTKVLTYVAHKFPGLGKEFMPPLDEGTFLFMPTTMSHASITEATDIIQKQDTRMGNIPEVDSVVGKLGRAETALDPAPISMVETVINYKSQYISDKNGKRLNYKYNPDENDFFRDEDGEPVSAPDGKPYLVEGKFIRDEEGQLIPDKKGIPFRLWRPALKSSLNEGRADWQGIKSPDDIWKQIVKAGEITGSTSAPKLQPIATRLIMLQSGMRAPMGIKVKGPDLETIEKVGLQLEKLLKEVYSVNPDFVNADRIVGKPYLEINIDREKAARYGIKIMDVQDVIEFAIGGEKITETVEGRERYPVRVRYMRELRDSIEAIERIYVNSSNGTPVLLSQVADIKYVRGPQMIKSEDTFLTGYVLFDKKEGFAEVDVVNQAKEYLDSKVKNGELVIPEGVSYSFSGNYENQVRSMKTLRIVLPLALFLIFIILYLQFNKILTSLLVFSGIFVAWAGGFILIWLYGQPWFLNFSVFGTDMRELFQVHQFNLTVAVWVGFLALFGIASDDGVVIATYLRDVFKAENPSTIKEIRQATIKAGKRRVRPCLMTSATTFLALIPVLTSTGRGADILVPMAIPSFGGMLLELITMFVVPVLYCLIEEIKLFIKNHSKKNI